MAQQQKAQKKQALAAAKAAEAQKAQKEQALAAAKAAEAISATGEGELGTEGRGTGQAPVAATAADAIRESKEEGRDSLAPPGGTSETVTDRRDGVEPPD